MAETWIKFAKPCGRPPFVAAVVEPTITIDLPTGEARGFLQLVDAQGQRPVSRPARVVLPPELLQQLAQVFAEGCQKPLEDMAIAAGRLDEVEIGSVEHLDEKAAAATVEALQATKE